MNYLKEYLMRVHRYNIEGDVTVTKGSVNATFRAYIAACCAWIDAHPDTPWTECCYCFKGDETRAIDLPSIEYFAMGRRYVLYVAIIYPEQEPSS